MIPSKIRIAAACLMAVGCFVCGWRIGGAHWKSEVNQIKAEGWETRYQREKAAREALERQARDREQTVLNNAEVIDDYRTKLDTIDAERARIGAQLRRVLTQASRACPGGDPVPPADGGPGAPEAGGDAGDGRFPQLAEAAIAECRRNAGRLDAIVEQLTPQL